MNTRSKFDKDFDEAYDSIDDAIDSLLKKMPNEMVALVLLRKVRHFLEGFADLDQWEFVMSDLIDVRNEFENGVESRLTNSIDLGRDEEKYNKRYG